MHAFRDHEVRPLISTKRHSASGGFSSSSVSALRSKSFQSLAQPHSSSTDGDPSASQSAAHHSTTTSSTLQRLKQLQQRNSGNLWRRRVHAQGVSLVVESFDAWLSPTKYQGTPAPASSSFSHHRNGCGSWVLRDNDAVLCTGPPRTGKTEFSYLVAATHLARGGQVHFLVVQGLGQPFNIRRFVTVLEGALRREQEQEGQRTGIQKNNPSSSSSSSSSLQDAVTRLVDHHLAVTVCRSLEDLRVTLQNPHKTFPLSPASITAVTPCVVGNNKHGTREGSSASKKRGREAEDAVAFPSNLSLLKGNHPPQAVWTRGDVGTTRRSGSSKSDTENRREGDDEDDETGPPPVVPLVVLDGLGAASYSHQKWKSLGQLHDLSSLLQDDLPRYCQLQECALLMIETTFPVDQRGGGGSGSQGGPMDNSPLLLAVQRTLHRQGSHARRSAVAALSWQTQHQHNHRNNNGHAVSIGSLPSSGAPPLAMVGLLSFHRCGVVPPSQQAVLMKDEENNDEEEEEATKEGEKNASLLKEYSVRYHVAVSSLSTRPLPPTTATTAASSLLASSHGHTTKYHHPPQTGVGLQSRDEGALWFAIDHSGVIW